jgi:hypothetical protein
LLDGSKNTIAEAGLEDRVLQPIAADNEPMRYLVGYVRHLEEQGAVLADPELARIAAVHLRTLMDARPNGATIPAAAKSLSGVASAAGLV